MVHNFLSARKAITAVIVGGLLLCSMDLMSPKHVQAEATSEKRPQFVHVVPSTKSFAQTVQNFKKELSRAGWSVVNVTNMAGMLSEKGFTLDPLMILDVCSGKYSAQILSKDSYRPLSAFMPCRVSIYKTSEGNTFISRMNTGAFAENMPPEVARIMAASDEEIAAVIAKAVKNQ